jgi:hypothetical protein
MLADMGKLRGAVALLAIGFACGGPKRGTNPGRPVPATTKNFSPLTIKDDAKAPNQAVIPAPTRRTARP